METLIKIVSLCLTAAVLTALLKQNEPTFSLLLAFAAVLLGGVLLVSTVSDAAALGDELIALTGLSPALFAPLLKVAAVALVTRVSAALCADAGQSALGRMTETAGAFCALGCALPLLRAVIDLLKNWL